MRPTCYLACQLRVQSGAAWGLLVGPGVRAVDTSGDPKTPVSLLVYAVVGRCRLSPGAACTAEYAVHCYMSTVIWALPLAVWRSMRAAGGSWSAGVWAGSINPAEPVTLSLYAGGGRGSIPQWCSVRYKSTAILIAAESTGRLVPDCANSCGR